MNEDSSTKARRLLTPSERFVLSQIQDLYGRQNSDDKVFFSNDEAVIFAVNAAGESVIAVALTNLARWYSDGTIKSVHDLREKWLQK